eukprot:m.122720 g.122720  ORF g.122720 m.122720 type:complete len:922 (+) comp16573_c0_seq4:343-3108(+)
MGDREIVFGDVAPERRGNGHYGNELVEDDAFVMDTAHTPLATSDMSVGFDHASEAFDNAGQASWSNPAGSPATAQRTPRGSTQSQPRSSFDFGFGDPGATSSMRKRQGLAVAAVAGAGGPQDNPSSFFQRGREFESIYTSHQFTAAERDKLREFESCGYLPDNSLVYKQFLSMHPQPSLLRKWTLFGLIGFSIALISFMLRQLIDLLIEQKYNLVRPLIEEDKWPQAWGVAVAYSVGLVFVSSLSVVFVAPAAASSGVPELIAYLNGVRVPHVFDFRTFIVKLFSCVTAVGSGLPVGPEGPMIHMGAMIGAGIGSQRGWSARLLKEYRNVKDKRDFVTCGVAAGVAAAFGAPVGGLLFAFEEVASFWSIRLGWMIFFACMVAVFFSDVLNSAFSGFGYSGRFGSFSTESSILFSTSFDINFHALALVPTVVLGLIGGVLGTAFTFLNLKIVRWRQRNILPYPWRRVAEPCLIMFIMATLSVLLPLAFSCREVFNCTPDLAPGESTTEAVFLRCDENKASMYQPRIDSNVESYRCAGRSEPFNISCVDRGTDSLATCQAHNMTYNDFATLIYVPGEEAIHHLFTRGTHKQLSYGAIATMLIVYFLGACWAAGTAVSSGLVVPMLLIGACYGRMIGMVASDLATEWGSGPYPAGSLWAWIDPGVFALIGAGSFFGGVSRLTIALTVIMIEISDDVHMLLPIMISILIAKWIADCTTHALYEALMETKCMPVLATELPPVPNYDLVTVSKIMASPPRVVLQHPTLAQVHTLLTKTSHGAFPVVKRTALGNAIVGLVSRANLRLLLSNRDLHFRDSTPPAMTPIYEDVFDNEVRTVRNRIVHDPHIPIPADAGDSRVDVTTVMNESVVTINERFSVARAYILFRTMGLRHLPVVDDSNAIVGMLTRKDLLGQTMEYRLAQFESQT